MRLLTVSTLQSLRATHLKRIVPTVTMAKQLSTLGPLTTQEKELIKATVPILKQSGTALTKQFYSKMLEGHPELKNTFSLTKMETDRQPKALAFSLLAYAQNIDDLTPLGGFVEDGTSTFASLTLISEDQY